LKETFAQLENWLLNSGIATSSTNSSDNGGVHSFYDIKHGSFGFLYPEITGFFIDSWTLINEA